MKKYITIAALFSAGAVFANAETLVDVATITNNEAIWAIETETGSLTTLSDYWAVQFKFDEFEAAYSGYDAIKLNGGVYVDVQTNSTKKEGYTGFQFDGVAHWLTNGDSTTGTSLLYSDLTAHTFTVVNNAGAYSFWVDGVQMTIRNGDGKTDGGATVSPGSAGAKSIASGFDVVGNTDWVKIASFDAGTDVSSVVATLNATPVPEPSAFGMLAGLGALALVAARRRRK